jgi:hypothetical protein
MLGPEPIGYRGALLSSLLHVNVYVTHNLLNVLVQIANKMGLKNQFLMPKYPTWYYSLQKTYQILGF